jgi:hypothetical protein
VVQAVLVEVAQGDRVLLVLRQLLTLAVVVVVVAFR